MFFYIHNKHIMSLAPAALSTSTLKNKIDAVLGVKDVQKDTICTWYLALFCIFAIVYLVQIVGIMTVLPNLASAWILLPVLLGDAIVLANLYFYYAMCSKLPEGFVSAMAEASRN